MKPMRFLPILAVASWISCSAHSQSLPPDLDTYIEQGMAAWKVPGLGIAVVKDGAVVLSKGYGVRTFGQPEPVDENTIFAIGSTSKAFTSAAIGTLVDAGALDWNSHVVTLWPEFKLADPWVTEEIRVSDLLANHSGLGAISEALWYGTTYDRDQIISRLAFVPIEEGFRYQFQYRNVMFLAAGQLIPQVDGRTWDQYLTDTFFIPLGMSRTFPTEAPIGGLSNVAQPHVIGYDGNPVPLPYRNMNNIAPAGSIASCVKDMANWAILHLSGGEFNGQQIIEEQTVEFMHRSQTPLSSVGPAGQPLSPPTELPAYCLGWVTQSYKGTRIVWHNGGIDGMSTWVGLVPDLNLGVVVTSNLDECDLRKAIFYKIVDAYVGNPPTDLDPALLDIHEALLAARNAREAVYQNLGSNPQTPALPLAKYAGKFRNSVIGDAEIVVENGQLVYHRTPLQVLDLRCSGGNSFLGKYRSEGEDLRSGKADVVFTVKNGMVTDFSDEGFVIYRALSAPPVSPAIGSIGRRSTRGASMRLTGTVTGDALRVEYRMIGKKSRFRSAIGVSNWSVPLHKLSRGKNQVIVRVIGTNGAVAQIERIVVRRRR